MFSNRIILLSTLLDRAGTDLCGATLLRDCKLSHVAKVPSRVARRIVPCGKLAHLQDAITAHGVVGVIVPEALAASVPVHLGVAIAQSPIAIANRLHETLCSDASFHWDSFDSVIDSSAQIHSTAYVAPKDVVIGPNSVVHQGAIILPRSVIGAHCAIGPGTVVGADAFEVDTTVSPRRILSQAGGVWLEDHVEIQAKCTIVRSTFGGFTAIGRESKFDCQVHLAHDCVVGKRVMVAGCAEISGRVTIGDDAFIGPNCSISNGVFIGARAHVTLGAVVVKGVADDQRVSGNFAVDHARLVAHIKAIR